MHQKTQKYKPKPERLRTISLPHHKPWSSNKPCFRLKTTGQCQLGSFCPYAHPHHYPEPRPLKKKYIPKPSVSSPTLSSQKYCFSFQSWHERTLSSKRAIIQSEIRSGEISQKF